MNVTVQRISKTVHSSNVEQTLTFSWVVLETAPVLTRGASNIFHANSQLNLQLV
jgi:hypothetical protein